MDHTQSDFLTTSADADEESVLQSWKHNLVHCLVFLPVPLTPTMASIVGDHALSLVRLVRYLQKGSQAPNPPNIYLGCAKICLKASGISTKHNGDEQELFLGVLVTAFQYLPE